MDSTQSQPIEIPVVANPSQAIPSSQKQKQTSDAWSHFKKIEIEKDGKKEVKAECNYCKKLFSCASTGGTSHLKRHKDSCIKRTNLDIRQMQLNVQLSGKVGTFKYNVELGKLRVVTYILEKDLPFSTSEDDAFVEMITGGFCPEFKSFSRNTCRNIILKMHQDGKEELKKYFCNYQGKISLTSDLWKAKHQNLYYMCITAHFLDDEWRLNKRIISFIRVEKNHTGVEVGDLIASELVKWGIRDKIFSITLDNASSNDVVQNYLKAILLELPLKGKLLHVRCCAHILNLIVQDGLKTVNQSISNIRSLVTTLHTSPTKYQTFQTCCQNIGLKLRNVPLDGIQLIRCWKWLQNIKEL